MPRYYSGGPQYDLTGSHTFPGSQSVDWTSSSSGRRPSHANHSPTSSSRNPDFDRYYGQSSGNSDPYRMSSSSSRYNSLGAERDSRGNLRDVFGSIAPPTSRHASSSSHRLDDRPRRDIFSSMDSRASRQGSYARAQDPFRQSSSPMADPYRSSYDRTTSSSGYAHRPSDIDRGYEPRSSSGFAFSTDTVGRRYEPQGYSGGAPWSADHVGRSRPEEYVPRQSSFHSSRHHGSSSSGYETSRYPRAL